MARLIILEAAVLILISVGFVAFLSSGGWATSPLSSVTVFNTTFWDIDLDDPLNCSFIYAKNFTFRNETILQYDVWFDSQDFNGSSYLLHGVLLDPLFYGLNVSDVVMINDTHFVSDTDALTFKPGILLLHGTNGSAQDMLGYGKELAASGYVILVMDSPGCGDSMGPGCTAANTINFSNGPYSAYYYHNVMAASRAISALASYTSVNDSAIAVSGVSMGGIDTFLVSAVDSRVKAAIPVVASGFFDEILAKGSLVNFIIPSNIGINDPSVKELVKYFDCRAYAQNLSVPTLMLIGTNDEYFFLDAVNKTYSLIPSEKALNLAPNIGHSWADERWMASVYIWLNHSLKGQPEALPVLPSFSVEQVNFYTGLKMKIQQPIAGQNYSLIYRTGMPGSLWVEMDLSKSDTISMLPLPSTYEYYLAAKENDTIISTSPVYSTQATSSLFIISVLFLLAVILILAFNWKEFISSYASSSLLGTVVFMLSITIWLIAAASLAMPWLEISGKASMNLMQVWDNFATHLPPFTLVLVATIIPLIAFAVRIWIGGIVLLLSFAWVYSLLLPLLALGGGAVVLGGGAYLLGACIAASLVIAAVLKLVRG